MRTNLTAVLSFGVVSCPVGVATESKEREIEFRNLHEECGNPVNEEKVCRHCDKSQLVEADLIKGFEFSKGTFVKFTQDEIKLIKGERSPIIKIDKFVHERDITIPLVKKSYILVPREIPKPYEILGYSLMQVAKAGIGTARLWGKESPVAVVSVGGVLHLRMLYALDEVNSDAEVHAMLKTDFTDDDAQMAAALIDLRSGDLESSDMVNYTKVEFSEALEQKLAGEVIMAKVEPAPEITFDTLAALRESVEQAKRERATA